METPTSPIPTPDPVQPVIAEVKKDWPWAVILIVALVLSNLFCGYSWKQTTDKLTKLQEADTHSEVVSEPATVVNGKVYYKTVTVHDTKTQTLTVHDKSETIIKSGVSLGLAYSTKMNYAGTITADLFPLGPGNLQVQALAASSGEIFGGAAYRINF